MAAWTVSLPVYCVNVPKRIVAAGAINLYYRYSSQSRSLKNLLNELLMTADSKD